MENNNQILRKRSTLISVTFISESSKWTPFVDAVEIEKNSNCHVSMDSVEPWIISLDFQSPIEIDVHENLNLKTEWNSVYSKFGSSATIEQKKTNKQNTKISVLNSCCISCTPSPHIFVSLFHIFFFLSLLLLRFSLRLAVLVVSFIFIFSTVCKLCAWLFGEWRKMLYIISSIVQVTF